MPPPNPSKPHTDPTTCPECKEPGVYTDEYLLDSRGIYTCSQNHRWQDGNEPRRNNGQ